MALYVVMLGAPGSGKGTQAKRLSAAFHVPHISTGDMFRAMKADTSELARRVRAIMERGELVPDDLTIEMVRERLKQPDARAGAIFDGFPRTIEQANALDAMLEEMYGEQIDVALLLNVPEDEITRRILKRAEVEGRADDTEEVIHKRHQTYL
ncbi:MAG TPA: adenylate kinase, partial [Aggregatilineales bacterium]|nr:adenylate kinase [Aggregatilineales bacterium]